MRLLNLAAVILLPFGADPASARDAPGGALEAIDQLPRGEARRIARIEARDGTPVPERWHIITHDPKDDNGLHEFVVAGREVVASRKISQFVETVRPEDVISSSAVKVDSDRLAALAQEFAFANNLTIAALNYALKKEGAEAVPLWNVGCLDEAGKEFGRVVISATKGTVISHDGFTAVPGAEVLARLETQSGSEAAREERRPAPKRPTVVRAVPVTPAPAAGKKGFLGRLFGGDKNERR